MSPPWMPFYPTDYLADTVEFSTLEHGAYLLLILNYWREGGLPDDEGKLQRITRLSPKDWARCRDALSEKFSPEWRHKRIDEELSKAQAAYERRSGAGRKGAEAKWGESVGTETRSQRLSAAREKASHTDAEWKEMLSLFGGCVACGTTNDDAAGGAVCKDHIVPIAKGGSDGIDNIQPLCRQCNSSKSGRAKDYRCDAVPDWREQFNERMTHGKRMANAWPMTSNPSGSGSESGSHSDSF